MLVVSCRAAVCGLFVSSGFSLVELLVVIAVIGLLAGLLLPAVQASRESARRMTCLNNLHQIGLGVLAFHDVYKRFPEGGVEMRSLRGPDGKLLYPNGRQLAWSAYILPYVELQSLARRIDFRKAFDSPENAAAAAEIVPLYLCPSNPRQSYLVPGTRGVRLRRNFRRDDFHQQQSAQGHDALRPIRPHPRHHRRHFAHHDGLRRFMESGHAVDQRPECFRRFGDH